MLVWGLCCVLPDAKISLCSTVQHSLFNRRWQFRIRFIQLSSCINYWNGLGFPCLGENLSYPCCIPRVEGNGAPRLFVPWKKATGNAVPSLLKSPTKPCCWEFAILRTCCKTQLRMQGLGEANGIDQHYLEEGRGVFFFFLLFFLVRDKKSQLCAVVSSGWIFKSLQKIFVVCFPPSLVAVLYVLALPCCALLRLYDPRGRDPSILIILTRAMHTLAAIYIKPSCM